MPTSSRTSVAPVPASSARPTCRSSADGSPSPPREGTARGEGRPATPAGTASRRADRARDPPRPRPPASWTPRSAPTPGGSILVPAANCGVYGLRPTVGLLSRRGALPITLAQDTPGPLALRVAHLAAALGGMRPDDHRRYHDALRVDRLAGARIALCLAGPEADAQTAWADAVATLLTAGVDLRPATTAIPVDGPSDLLVPAFDFRDSVGEYFDALPAGSPVRDFDTLYAHYRDATPDEQPYGIDNIEASARVDLRADRALRNRLRADEYDAAQRVLEHLREIDGVDAVLFPGPLATFLASKSGHPAVALPAGTLPGGRPFALSLLATRPDDEQYLLDLAASWEHLNGPTPSACP
nr:amidase family protein [Microbacterium sp. SORGH_AS_0454]